MILDILKQGQYYIACDISSKNKRSNTLISWEKTNIFGGSDKTGQHFYDGYNEQLYKNIPDYAFKSYLYVMLNNIAKQNKYPMDWIDLSLDGKQLTSLNQLKIDDTDQAKADILLDLTKNICKFGLQTTDIEVAKKSDIFEGFQAIIKRILDIDINTWKPRTI